jgi:hypothetical protein
MHRWFSSFVVSAATDMGESVESRNPAGHLVVQVPPGRVTLLSQLKLP